MNHHMVAFKLILLIFANTLLVAVASPRIYYVRSTADFEQQLEDAGDKLVLAIFSATWCHPCKTMAPDIEELSAEETNIEFVKVDVGENKDIMENYRVAHIPTFLFFKNKCEKQRLTSTDFGELQRILRRLKRLYSIE